MSNEKKKDEKKEDDDLEKLKKFPIDDSKPVTLDDKYIDHYAKIIAGARKIVIFSGAGISAESGISTFRGAKGVWSGISGIVALGYFGTPVGWKLTSRLAYKLFRKHFFEDIGKAKPNVGHYALGELSKLKEVHCITQNVDSLHQIGGIPEKNVYEVHGTVRKYRCIKNGHPYDMGVVKETIPESSPKCKKCKSYIRPDFVLFTESLPSDVWRKAISQVYTMGKDDLMIVIGTSSVVYPAASIPEIANQMNVKILEINLVETKFSKMSNCKLIKGKAGEVLTKLVRRSKYYIKRLKGSIDKVRSKINDDDDDDSDDDIPIPKKILQEIMEDDEKKDDDEKKNDENVKEKEKEEKKSDENDEKTEENNDEKES